MGLFRKKAGKASKAGKAGKAGKADSGNEPLSKVIGYKGKRKPARRNDADDTREDKIKRISGGFGSGAS